MRKLNKTFNALMVFVLMLAIPIAGLSQTSVSGKVTDSESGETIPGVSILIKGTSNGTITDVNGDYSLDAASDATLVFSFVGYKQTEVNVGGRSRVDVSLAVDVTSLDEVVVTALGISREEKTLTYAQQTVDGSDLTQSRDINFLNALSGRTAGVEIKKSSSGPGGSTRVVLRGDRSLEGDSQPLFVVDGIPLANTRGGQPACGEVLTVEMESLN
jgi:hypothetical protein